MRTRTWCVAGALVSLAAPVMGQTVLSEADALARLSPDSARVRAIRASVDVARADVIAAGRWPNPRVTVNRESVSGITENMVTVAQPLPITGRRGLEVSAASAAADATARRADEALRQARAELRTAYAELVSAQAREASLSRARTRLAELVDAIGRRERAGDAAGYERLRAERELLDFDADLAATSSDRSRALAVLGAFFDEATDVTAISAVVPGFAPRAPVPTVDELLMKARDIRGESLALRRDLDAAAFAERAASRRAVPEPELVAGTKSSSSAGGDVGSVVSIHLSVPIFDRGRPERALAQARMAQAEAQLASFNRTLRAQIVALRAAVIERRDAADRYRAASSTMSTDLERIAQVSYDAGERGILELLDAYRSGAAARVRQAVFDAAARQAEIELEFVSGWEVR